MRLLLYSLIVCFICSCSHKKKEIEYYIFSKQDSINSQWKFDSNNNQYYPPPPPPPPPPFLTWYADLVMIFDTANMVYIYQTECIYKRLDSNENYIVPSDKYPNFIRLSPNQILTLRSDYLIDFIKDNDRYFKLDTNYHDSNRFFYIVSDFDTIKNLGYYNLISHIKSDKRKIGRIFHSLRRTTEEEKNVLSCLRINKYYNTNDFTWSSNFIDGTTTPFTAKYDSLDKLLSFKIRSKDIFKPKMINIKPIK